MIILLNVRAEIVRNNCSVSEVARRLKSKGKKVTPEGLNNKIRLGRIRLSEVEEILSELGCEIKVVKKNLLECG